LIRAISLPDIQMLLEKSGSLEIIVGYKVFYGNGEPTGSA
jgi:hypothetical protein